MGTVWGTHPRVHHDVGGMAWVATGMEVLKVSNVIWITFSRWALGFRRASVSRTGCSQGPQPPSPPHPSPPQLLLEQWFSTFLMPRPLNTAPHVVATPNHTITFVATS